MKKILMTGIAFAALTTASDSLAQAYSKGNDNLMNDAEYIQPSAQPARSTRTEVTPAQTSSSIEPRSGRDEYDFTGPYVGADIGYNIGSYDVSDPVGPDGDAGLDGFEGGIFAGWGMVHEFNSWGGGYLGLEAGYEWSGADGGFAGNSFDKDHAWVISLRPGLTMNQDVLGYGIIGYSRAEFEGNGDDKNLDGLILGAGSEFNTQSPLKMRLEYTYTTYEDATLAGLDFDGHENQIKAGAVFRF